MRRGFTLAEILITLLVIGVVAALIIPGVITKINDRVNTRQNQVIKQKFVDGLNLLNAQENGLSRSYESTYEFVEHLSKYLKIIKICDSDNLKNCFPYEYITLDNNIELKIADIKSPQMRLGLNDTGFKDTAAFMMANGTSFLVSYKQDCGSDPDKPLKEISECVAGFYDLNGAKLPNMPAVITAGKNGISKITGDIIGFSQSKINSKIKIGNVTFTSQAFKITTPLTSDECESMKSKLKIQYCDTAQDYWAAARKACDDQNARFPVISELYQFQYLSSGNDLKNILGINDDKFTIWRDGEWLYTATVSAGRLFEFTISDDKITLSGYRGRTKDAPELYVMCVEK